MEKVVIYGGDMGSDTCTVTCDTRHASAPVFADFGRGEGICCTQYQSADGDLIDLARKIVRKAMLVGPGEEFEFDYDHYHCEDEDEDEDEDESE